MNEEVFMKVKKRTGIMVGVVVLLLAGALVWSGGQQGEAAAGKEEYTFSFWTFQQFHIALLDDAAERWNQEYPDKKIAIESSSLPYEDLHSKLLVALQSGVGAPDVVDIEISKFANFLKGKVQLANFKEYVDPVRDKFITARFEIYSKDGNVYGLPYHVGATVLYYNMDHLDAAGVKPEDIGYWTSDYVAAAKKVKSATGKFMTTFESNDQWSFWPMISQQKSDYFNEAGEVILDNEINVRTLQFQYDMIYEERLAALPPGGYHHTEEFYGFLNSGEIASLMMPMWYMGRFVDYCPDLSGKILVQPMPRWERNGFRSAGMGGTGTAVTNQCEHMSTATDFLAYAKLTKEANIKIWEVLGFDPPRWDVWDSPELKAENKYTQYFINGPTLFETLLEVKDEIMPVNITEQTPRASDLVKSMVVYRVLESREQTPYEALHEAAEELR
jgi:arabinosaccharide transport system substrate-binding protein